MECKGVFRKVGSNIIFDDSRPLQLMIPDHNIGKYHQFRYHNRPLRDDSRPSKKGSIMIHFKKIKMRGQTDLRPKILLTREVLNLKRKTGRGK